MLAVGKIVLCQCVLAPGEEIVPSKEPALKPMAASTRSPVTLPVAPANRPVPPVIVTGFFEREFVVPGIGVATPRW